jgi:RND family efflux transporter MFP subunit
MIKHNTFVILLHIFAILFIFSALAVSTFLTLRGKDVQGMPAEAPIPAALTVSVTRVTETEWPEIIKATGPISAWQEAVIGTEVSGQRLIDVMADVGDLVKKGQILARFNPDTLMAEYAELEANWIAAESKQKRALTLKSSGAMSHQTIEEYVNQAAVAKAQMDAKVLQLKYADIVAPDDGVISARNATLGAVGAEGDELFRLIRQNRLEWRGELTVKQAAHIVQGQPVALTLPNGNKAEGSIRKIAPSFNPETRMTTIFVDIKTDCHAQAGMYAEGEIMIGQQTAMNVPAKSVVIRDGRNYVFNIRNHPSGGIVRQHEVQVGQIRGNEAQILSGIAKGDRMVVMGAGFLNDGDIVRVSPEKGGEK